MTKKKPNCWTAAERAFCVERLLQSNSATQVCRDFQKHFRRKTAPSRKSIYAWLVKFRTMGTVVHRNQVPGRPRSGRSQRNIDEVRACVDDNPELSVRRQSLMIGLSTMTTHRILTTDLCLKPYRIQVKQRLKNADYGARLAMCQRFLDSNEEDNSFIDRVWFSDESHFYLDGKIHARNAIYWSDNPPQFVLQRPLHAQRCTAWMAFSSKGVIGPFWFDGNVNSKAYIEVLKTFKTALTRQHLDLREQIFMQDGATPHTSRISMDWLSENFGPRVISKNAEFEWAPYSPDLNPLDFFFVELFKR